MKSPVCKRVVATAAVVAAVSAIASSGAVASERSTVSGVAEEGGRVDSADVEIVPGEYVVMLRPPVGASAPSSQPEGVTGGEDLSARIRTVLSRLDRVVGGADASGDDPQRSATDGSILAELPVIDGFGARLSAVEAAALEGFDDVLSVEPNRRVRVTVPAVTPSNGGVELPWGVDRIDQAKLPLDGSYTPPGTGEGVTAYVIDSGVWSQHREFDGRVIQPMVDFVGDSPSPDRLDPECLIHGTHVAATLAGTNVGVAPKARVQAVRVLDCDGSGDELTLLRSMDWVAQHARLPAVANMSLVYYRSAAIGSAVRYMTAKGVTVVAAAGNDDDDACEVAPSFEPSAITVGASDLRDRVADFSNVGPCVDLFAPGVSVLSALPGSADAYWVMSGTSMASPHVAGTAALYLAAHPTATPDAVERAIVAGATADVLRGGSPSSPNLLLQVNDLPDPVNKPSTDPFAHIAPPGGTEPIRVNTPVTFDGRGSLDPAGGALRYEWRVQGIEGVAGTEPTVTITPGEIGEFEVALKVTNAAGASSTDVLRVDISPPTPPVIKLTPAGFQQAQPGAKLSWDASGSYNREGGKLTFRWRYWSPGGVIGATGPTFSTTFEGGYASLSLTVTNEAGGQADEYVDIYQSPTAVISPPTADIQVGETVTFDGGGSVDPGDGEPFYEWQDSLDGLVMSTKPTYTRTFDRVGTFDVFLTFSTNVLDDWLSDTAVARIRVHDGPTSSTSTTLVPPPPPATVAMAAMEPVRVLDTRWSGFWEAGRRDLVGAGRVVRVPVGQLPTDAAGVVLNVTAVNPVGDGHLTVYPCGERPRTSNVNYRAGVTSANAVVTSLGRRRELCVWSFAPTDVVVDVTGYVPAGSGAHTLDSVRAIDTRTMLGAGFGRVSAGGVLEVPVSSVSDVPPTASAVFVNVTAANPSGDGHLTVYGCGDRPGTSNVNYRAGVTKANLAVVRLASDGSLCVKTYAESDVVVDVLGFVDANGGVELTSKRQLDTRGAEIGSMWGRAGPIAGGSVVKVPLDVDPATTAGVFLSVAAVNPSGDGHLTVFPCGKPPTASMLNYRAGVTTSNMVFSKVDRTGSVCVSTYAGTDLVVDYNGKVSTPT